MDCLICFNFNCDQINVQNFSSIFCKLLELTDPGFSTEIFNSTTTICPECTQKLQKVHQLYDQLDSILAELDEFKRQFYEDLIKSEKLSQEAGNQLEERTKIVQELTKEYLDPALIPEVKLENIEEPNSSVFQDYFESPFFDNIEDLNLTYPGYPSGSDRDLKCESPITTSTTASDARIILEPLPEIKGQTCDVEKEPIASFIKRDTKRLKNSSIHKSISTKINSKNLKKIFSSTRKRSNRTTTTTTKVYSPDTDTDSDGVVKLKRNPGLGVQKTTVQNKKHICNECGLGFCKNSRLVEHMRKHTGETPFSCSICHKQFRTKQALMAHEVNHGIGSKAVKCTFCDRYLSKYKIQKHLEDHQKNPGLGLQKTTIKNKKHVCTECGVGYFKKSRLDEHMRKHTGETPFSCSICHKQYRTKQGLMAHEVMHGIGPDAVKCSFCDRYLSKYNLQKHIEDHHLQLKNHLCDFCPMSFRNEISLKNHRLSLHLEQKFNCKKCDKIFDSFFKLRAHLLSDHKKLDISIQCAECGKEFSSKFQLYEHNRNHLRSKQCLPCNICGKLIKSKNLKHHVMIKHNDGSEVLPFQCTFTGCKSKGFVSKSRQNHHMKLHTGQDYICPNPICLKSYKYKSSLDSHLKICKSKPINEENVD